MTAIVILAAGASSRMGRPKQLLHYQKNNLLLHAIEVALATGYAPVIVVLGANADIILPMIKNSNVIIVQSENWEEGLGASVRIGIGALTQEIPLVDSALIMLCDQPFVTPKLLQQLVETKAVTNKKIVASNYKNTAGVPVVFDKYFFPELLQLQGHDGAKKLLTQYPDNVATVPFPEGAIDIDTPEDYQALSNTPHVFHAGSILLTPEKL